MDQIEKPLSILLIVAAIAYAFMYTDAGDGFTAIENNTASGYNIEASELSSTGYTIQAADLSKGYKLDETCSEKNDSLISITVDAVELIYVGVETIDNDSTIINDTEAETVVDPTNTEF